jgi:catechol 2,3-dioxygenase-like lactoylglutathione lyase family enzyme
MTNEQTKKWITNVHHGGIIVSDMEKSLSFYRDLLGCEMISKDIVSGENIDKIVGLKNARMEIVNLRVGQSDDVLELLHYFNPPSKPLSPDSQANDIGVGHICFKVYDMDKAYKYLSEKGVNFFSAPQVNQDRETTSVYFRDPDGIILELYGIK